MFQIRRIFPLLLSLVILTACNYPGVAVPTAFEFPTPDLTMTALFEQIITTTATPQDRLQTATPSATNGEGVPAETATPVPPTATVFQTPTNTATESLAGPSIRPGPSIEAVYFQQPPVIDGTLDEWTQERTRIETVVFGNNQYTGAEDLSARLIMGWDEDHLYIAARILDDRYVQEAQGAQIFRGDSLEILLDVNVPEDYYQQILSLDDYQIGISPGFDMPGNAPEAYLWFPTALEGEQDGVKIDAVGFDEGYKIEAAIPWSIFNIDPQQGQHFGFAFSVSDNDNPNTTEQQTMISSASNRVLTAPNTWRDLVLVRP